MDELSSQRDAALSFAAQHAMPVVPATPYCESGPEVSFKADVLDLAGFLDLAHRLGSRALYVETTPFEPDPSALSDPPQRLLQHSGELGLLEVVFVTGGVVHAWEQAARFQAEWDVLVADHLDEENEEDEERFVRLSDAERDRLAGPVVEELLARSDFRAARAGARQRIARAHIAAADLHDQVQWHAASLAGERADEMTLQQYAGIDNQYDDLAQRLLADPTYQQAASSAGRKKVTEDFLTAWGDGFAPPTLARDELYARAQQMAKNMTKTGQSRLY